MLNLLPSVLPSHDRDGDNCSICELGAGTGITALFLHEYLKRRIHKGARVNLHITDGSQEVVDLINTNLTDNDIFHNDPSDAGNLRVSTAPFVWSMSPDVTHRYDVIYAADVIYEYNSAVNSDSSNNIGGSGGGVEGLMHTIRCLLSLDEGDPDLPHVPPPRSGPEVATEDSDSSVDYEEIYPPFAKSPSYTGGYFFLSLTRRSVPYEVILKFIADAGLIYCGVLENSTRDMFGNETDGVTALWTDLILGIRRRDKNGM